MHRALAALLLLLAGCGPGPFARAATAYADANAASINGIAKAPRTAVSLCRKRAQASYLQTRLGLLAAPLADARGLHGQARSAPEPPAPVPWNRWYDEAKATEKHTWARYCGEIAATGRVFAVALRALGQYGAALKALAAGEDYDGADIEASVASTSKIADALESPGASAAMKPVGNLIGRFAAFLVRDITEDQLEDYIRKADPLVQALVEGIDRYLAALEDERKVTENARRQALLALEARSDLMGQASDPTRLMIFFATATTTEEELEQARIALAGYRAVLKQLREAHGALVKAGAAGDEIEIKKALGATFEILTQIHALSVALAQEG
jgi:hypothetical protein